MSASINILLLNLTFDKWNILKHSHPTVIFIPKNSATKVLNKFRPLTLTSLVMKAMERIVKQHIIGIANSQTDPLQFASATSKGDDAKDIHRCFACSR